MEENDLIADCDPEMGPDWNFLRRLLVLQRLVSDTATRSELIAYINQIANLVGAGEEHIWPGDPQRILRNDLDFLCDRLGAVSLREAHQRKLHIPTTHFPLIHLTEAEVNTFAGLQRQFHHQSTPHSTAVRRLLGKLIHHLSAKQRQFLKDAQGSIDIKQPENHETIDERLYNEIAAARGRRRIAFAYHSPRRADGRAIRHVVDPYRLFVRDGHTYLAAYQREPTPRVTADGFKEFRLSRIGAASLQVLPDAVKPAPPRMVYDLHYRLTPRVARLKDINTWFRGSEVTYLDDGSADVKAKVKDLWIVEQTLLRYRAECTVLEPPELVERMRATVMAMYQLYHQPTDQDASADVEAANAAS